MRNKRRGPDPVVYGVKISVAVSWLIILGVIIAYSFAQPRLKGFEGVGREMVLGGGDPAAQRVIFFLLALQICISLGGLIFNVLRLKRKSDHISLTLVALLIISILGLLMSVI